MAYVPGCRHDLFISYATENNRDGWVEQFVTTLSNELGQLLGRQFAPKDSVFWDARDIETAQSVPDRVTAAARASAILVPILSPGYLDSRWCNRERTDFFSTLPYGASPADCLAPALIRPIDAAALEPLFRDARRSSFLSADDQTPIVIGSPEWKPKVEKFAAELRNALQNLRRKCRPVFLGKVADTERLQNLRDWCRTELEDRCFRTVPAHLHALDNPEAVRAALEEAGLAVHFLGGADSLALEAIEISVDLCSGPTILYQPFGIDLSTDERLWLEDFERSLKPQPGRYQRLAGKNDQELLALVDEHATRFRAASAPARPKVDLALVCDEADLPVVRQMKEDLAAANPFALAAPDFLGASLKSMERLRLWQDYLTRGEVHLFYHGQAERSRLDLIWQKAQLARPDARRTWFLAPPDLEDKLRDHPEALTTLNQVVRFVTSGRSAHA
jgi:hypothetical protein